MKPIETKQEYSDYVDKKSPNSPILKNCFNAFWVGGLICSVGQILFDFCKKCVIIFFENENRKENNTRNP